MEETNRERISADGMRSLMTHRRRIALRPPMSLSSLHTIELQLCMHTLDQQSLLQFARCSRATLAAASAPFAWLHHVATICTVQPKLDRLSGSLLRFARGVHLRWLSPDLTSSTHPSRRSTFLPPPSSPFPIVGLEVRGEVLMCRPQMERLTDLTVALRQSAARVVESIGRCRHLRRLAIRHLRADLLPMLLSAPLTELHTLEVDVFCASALVGEREYVPIQLSPLESLPKLHEIRLMGCAGGVWALRTRPGSGVESVPRRLTFSILRADELPARDELRLVLRALPRLTVTIELYRVHPTADGHQARLRDAVLMTMEESLTFLAVRLSDLTERAQALQDIDPTRIFISQPEEEDRRERSHERALARYAQSQKLHRSCIIA